MPAVEFLANTKFFAFAVLPSNPVLGMLVIAFSLSSGESACASSMWHLLDYVLRYFALTVLVVAALCGLCRRPVAGKEH